MSFWEFVAVYGIRFAIEISNQGSRLYTIRHADYFVAFPIEDIRNSKNPVSNFIEPAILSLRNEMSKDRTGIHEIE